jgi:hypothetical protein
MHRHGLLHVRPTSTRTGDRMNVTIGTILVIILIVLLLLWLL